MFKKKIKAIFKKIIIISCSYITIIISHLYISNFLLLLFV